jgi:hypothetical protein
MTDELEVSLTAKGRRLMQDMTPRLMAIVEAANPDYQVTTVHNVFPFKADADMIGASAGRIYLREQDTLTVITCSESQLRLLRDAIDRALEEGPTR